MSDLSQYNLEYFGLSSEEYDLSSEKVQTFLAVKQKLSEHPEKIDEQSRYKDPRMLFRYVEAREFILDQAYTMIVDDSKWRKEYNADQVLENWKKHRYYETLTNYWPAVWSGLDKDGSPIFWERIGAISPQDVAMEIPMDAFTFFRVALMEEGYRRRKEEGEKQGKFHRRSLMVVDVGGLGLQHLSKLTLSLFQRVGSCLEQHYPGTVKRVFIINAPAIFSKAFDMVKGYLPERTKKKITIFGNNFLDDLKQWIPEEHISTRYGGRSSEIINGGGPLSGVYKGAEEATVGARDSFQKSITITQPSIIAFDFKLTGYDIGFSIDFIPSGKSQPTNVYPYKKVVSTEGPVHDEIEAKDIGEYIFKWDNTYSMMTKKQFQFQIRVEANN